MASSRGACTVLAFVLVAGCLSEAQGQGRYFYYYSRDYVMAGRCTCKDTTGASVTFNLCTPSRGSNLYNQCVDCGMGNIMPKCQATARVRGLTDICTDYTALGCTQDCDNAGCRPNACYMGSC